MHKLQLFLARQHVIDKSCRSNWSPADNCSASIIGPINLNGKVRR